MDELFEPGQFTFTTPSGWGELYKLGVLILTIVVLILFIRETGNLIRGRPADYVGVIWRGGIAGLMLAVVPWAAEFLGGTAMAIGNMFHGQASANMEAALRVAMGSVQCDGTGFLDSLGLLFSLRGVTVFFGFIVFLVFMLVKIAVIDVGWKIMFSVVVFQAPLTLPLSAIEDLGGLSLYWRNVLGIAIWPVTFGMVMVLATATFPETISDMASGKTTLQCASAVIDVPEGAEDVAGTPNSILSFLKFLGLLVGMAFLTWKVPEMSAMIVGGSAAGTLGTAALGALLHGTQTVGAPAYGTQHAAAAAAARAVLRQSRKDRA